MPTAQPPTSAAPRLTVDGTLRSGRLAGLSLNRAIWVLTWPVLVESFLTFLVGMTDTVLAAGLEDGGAAADAIGFASYLLWFIGLIVSALGVGATALISRAVGASRLGVARTGTGQTVLLAAGSGVAAGLLLALASGPVSRALAMTSPAAEAFRLYMLINALGVPFASVLFGGIACLRGVGDSFRPMWIMAAVNAVNIAVSWTLAGVDLRSTRMVDGVTRSVVLVENPFDFNWGIAGIAWGTVSAQVFGAAAVSAVLIRGVAGVTLLRRRLRPHVSTITRLVRIGWPNFLETLGMWAGNFLVIMMVGWLGGSAGGLLGAHLIAVRIESLSFLPGFAIAIASATLAGQYLGAGSPALARRAVLRCTFLASLLMGLAGIAFIAVPDRIVGLMTAHGVHLAVTPSVLFIAGAFQVPFAIGIVLRQALRGAGDVRAAMWLTWITTYGVRLPLAYALSGVDIPLWGGRTIDNPFPFDGGLAGLWLGLCLELVVRAAAYWWRFASGAWARQRV
jgi:putative MATE family efflux protein